MLLFLLLTFFSNVASFANDLHHLDMVLQLCDAGCCCCLISFSVLICFVLPGYSLDQEKKKCTGVVVFVGSARSQCSHSHFTVTIKIIRVALWEAGVH